MIFRFHLLLRNKVSHLKLADEFLARTSVEQEQRKGKIISIGAGIRMSKRGRSTRKKITSSQASGNPVP